MWGFTNHGSVRAWCGHNLLAGALVGLVAGGLNFVLLCTQSSLSLHAAASLLVSVSVAALFMLLMGLATAPLLSGRRSRWVAAFLHGLAISLIAAVLLLSVILRATTGGYVTLGAIEFGLNAGQHVLRAALGPFGPWTLGLSALLLGVLVGAVWAALRRLDARTEHRLGHAAVIGAPAAIVFATLPAVAVPGLSATSPELAFVASLEDEGDEPMPPPGPEPPRAKGKVSTRPGPALSEGFRWRERSKQAKGPRPNVLILTLESVALRHLGYAGYRRDTTPNLDRIAANSLRMRRAWTTATHSNYAQMAVLSSLFPRRGSGLDVYQRLDYPRVLYHDLFHALGHATATFSSQDENWQGMLRFQQTATPTYFWHSPSFHGTHIDTGAELVVPDAVTVDQAVRWISRERRPWALYMNLQVTHFPYELPPGTPEPFGPTGPFRGDWSYVGFDEADRDFVINRYDNALRYVDAQIGRLEAALRERGELDDTLWVITSDHGELFLEHGLVTHGRTLYEAEARVPLLVHWPKRVPPADDYEPVSHLDILPTVLDLMDVEPHPALQGRSFAAARHDDDAQPGVFLNIQGLKSADALVCWPWKLITDRNARRVMLFNIEQDPDEQDDRAGRDVRVASDLFNVLRAQMAAQVAYHKPKSTERTRRYAPRMLSCPVLPGTRRAEAPADSKKLAPRTRSN